MKTIRIGKRTIGEGQPTYVIAEAGSNHDQSLSQAKKLIAVAKAAGADAVKFQLFKAEHLYAKDHPAFKVVRENEFPREWLAPLAAYAKKEDITFLATPFDREAVDLLVKQAMPAFKWGSSETTNWPLLRYAAGKKRPMLIATGMCDIGDIQAAVDIVQSSGNDQIALLHCVSVYPCPPDQIHLRVMDALKATFGCPIGFSDHSLGIALPLAAVARGACIIEKHFTLSRKLKGPDHSYALEPDELGSMIGMIREVEQSLGSSVKKMMPDEVKYGRRDGLYAARPLNKGHVLKDTDMRVARPAVGVRTRYLPLIAGQRLARSIKAGEAIHWRDLK